MRRAPVAANIVEMIIAIGVMALERAPPVELEPVEPELCPPEPLGTDESPLVLFG